MPPSAVKTVQDIIYWQYAKIIANSSGIGNKEFGFVMNRFKKLQSGQITWDWIREYIKERESPDVCAFCGQKGKMTIEHIVPVSCGGPDDEKNIAWICQSCNSSKGGKRLYEAWTIAYGLKAAKYDAPRLAEGKYLKFAFEALSKTDTLSLTMGQLTQTTCPDCSLHGLCVKEHSEGKLSPLCIDELVVRALQP